MSRMSGSEYVLDPVKPEPHASGPSALRILAVEDDPMSLLLIQEILTACGHQVEGVGTGREAVAAVERDSFDLVLMDIQMPGMDGVAAVAAIRRLESEGKLAFTVGAHRLPIIALTAYAMKGDREKYLAAGMDEHLPKPVTKEQLLKVVARTAALSLSRPGGA